jgi:hypothetical protein
MNVSGIAQKMIIFLFTLSGIVKFTGWNVFIQVGEELLDYR